jgi:hypothetical protein
VSAVAADRQLRQPCVVVEAFVFETGPAIPRDAIAGERPRTDVVVA